MRKQACSFVIFLIAISIFNICASFANDTCKNDDERLKAIMEITQEQWKKIINGDEEWPDVLFPLSFWSEKDLKRLRNLPESFHESMLKTERYWQQYIRAQGELFRKAYGTDVKNLYDLFLKEQHLMENPAYYKAPDPVKAPKTLKRLVDIAVLPAEKFKELHEIPTNMVRVFSFKLGALRTIPFDIIEFTAENQVVLPDGPEGNPEDGDAVFNGKDKLFFMAADAGHQIDREFMKEKFPTVVSIQEVEISFEEDKEKGWVYVAGFSNHLPEEASFDYVEFHPDISVGHSQFAYLQFAPQKIGEKIFPTIRQKTWIMAPSVGGIPIDFHEALFIDSTLFFLFGKRKQSEEKHNLAMRAWYDGKVIIYGRSTWKMATVMGIGEPPVFNDFIATPLTILDFVSWYIPFDPKFLLKHADISAGETLNKRGVKNNHLTKVRYFTSREREANNYGQNTGYPVDGVMSDDKKRRSTDPVSWQVLSGTLGTLCMRTGFDDYLEQNASPSLNWQDDIDTGTKYENCLKLESFKYRNNNFFLQWNLVPHFWNEDPLKYDWQNLDLVLKRDDKPLSYKFNGNDEITYNPFIHIPNIKNVNKRKTYKY